MQLIAQRATFCLALLLLVGCASSAKQESSRSDTVQQDSGIIGTIPPTSKFAKLSLGMSFKHVVDLIGPPTDMKTHITGKNFIPFYYGSDRVRREALYKGEGRITFTGRTGGSVYRIIYDPSEIGYADK
jgi:hypothetical protein